MTGTSAMKKLLESCTYRVRTVRCPTRNFPASVTAARWRMSDGRWTSWTILDCPLLPAGLVDCDKGCLAQLQEGTP